MMKVRHAQTKEKRKLQPFGYFLIDNPCNSILNTIQAWFDYV